MEFKWLLEPKMEKQNWKSLHCLSENYDFFVSLILWMSEKGRHRMGNPWDWERREWGKPSWRYVIQDDEYEEHSVKYVHAFKKSEGTRYSK